MNENKKTNVSHVWNKYPLHMYICAPIKLPSLSNDTQSKGMPFSFIIPKCLMVNA